MGLRSYLFRVSGGEARLAELKSRLAGCRKSNVELKSRLAQWKARPPRLPLRNAPDRETEFRKALESLRDDNAWRREVPGWPEITDRVGTAMSEFDIMLVKSNARAYAEVGLSALACVVKSLTAAKAPAPTRILDFGCGYGRVLRFLTATWPDAAVYGTDMDAEGLGFCTHHFPCFGMRTDMESGPQWAKIRFDLIWVGSVFTHLDIPNCHQLMRHLTEFLAPGGIVIFTTHGDFAINRMRNHEELYRLEPAVLDQIIADCTTDGHGYADYPERPGYGVSATSEEWVNGMMAKAGLNRLLFLPAGWDHHQDVFAAQRAF